MVVCEGLRRAGDATPQRGGLRRDPRAGAVVQVRAVGAGASARIRERHEIRRPSAVGAVGVAAARVGARRVGAAGVGLGAVAVALVGVAATGAVRPGRVDATGVGLSAVAVALVGVPTGLVDAGRVAAAGVGLGAVAVALVGVAAVRFVDGVGQVRRDDVFVAQGHEGL